MIFPDQFSFSPHLQRKFYFLDYFYILLLSVKDHSNQKDIFESFKMLKKKHLLGESKYKKLTLDEDVLTKKQLDKFLYTFEQIISESIDYDLIENKPSFFQTKVVPSRKISAKKRKELEREKVLTLTENGIKALKEYEKSKFDFNLFIFNLIENKHKPFFQLIKLFYGDKTLKNGLMVFPIYSALKLDFEKSSFTTHGHVYDYSKALIKQFETDINSYTNKKVSLDQEEKILIGKLKSDNIIGENRNELFNPKLYNATLSRFRKYWLNYFLKTVYNYPQSFSTFSICIERAKQTGILNTTEFFPDFSGRIVYPTSIISKDVNNADFMKVYEYSNGEMLFIHKPIWDANKDKFVETLLDEYLILQKTRKTHFINLLDLKERVCFKSRLPYFLFDDFLERSYNLNLKGELKIQISLEADKLPQETSAMYLRREPIPVNGKYKNIIALNYRRDDNE